MFVQRSPRRRQIRHLAPLREGTDFLGGLDCLLFAFSCHRQKIAVAHQRHHSRHRAHRRLIQRFEHGTARRRPHHATKHHRRQTHILHIGGLAADFFRNIATCNGLADDVPARRRLRLDTARCFTAQIGVLRQFPIRCFDAAAADSAITDGQLICRNTQAHGCSLHQNIPRLRRREMQRGSALLHRLAAGGHAFIRTTRGVRGNHFDALVIDIEFIGGDLGERGQDALPQLHLAGKNGHRAVGINAQPAIEHAIVLQAAGQYRRLRLRHHCG